MILERIEENQLLLQGLVGCQVPDSEAALKRVRSTFPDVQIQLMRADRIAGKEHLLFAARSAVRAFHQRYGRARTLAVELLLYASCQRQISKGIQLLGLKPQTHEVVLAAFSRKRMPSDLVDKVARVLQGSPDDRVLEVLSKKKARGLMDAYGVTRIQLEASRFPEEDENSVLKRLIIERSALLTLEG